MAANSLRWLSNWIVTPILRLGYRPLTLPRPLRTCRAGGDVRICRMTRSAWGLSPSLRHQSPNWGSASIRCSHARTTVPVGARRPARGLMPQAAWAPLRFETQAHGLEQLQRVVEGVDRQPVCEVVDPHALEPMDLVHGPAALWGKADELGSSVMRVVGKRHQPVRGEEVDRPLHALAGETHVPGKVRDREGLPGQMERAQDLPAGTGQPQRMRQAIPSGQPQPMQAANLPHHRGQGLSRGRGGAWHRLWVLHRTRDCHNDSLLSRVHGMLVHGLRPQRLPAQAGRKGRWCHACQVMSSKGAYCHVMIPTRCRERAMMAAKCLIFPWRIARLCVQPLPIYGLCHRSHDGAPTRDEYGRGPGQRGRVRSRWDLPG